MRATGGTAWRERIHRMEALELYAMDFDWLSDLANDSSAGRPSR